MKKFWPLFGFFGLWIGAMAAPHTTLISPRDREMFEQGAKWGQYVTYTNYDAVLAGAIHGRLIAPLTPDQTASEAFREYIAAQP